PAVGDGRSSNWLDTAIPLYFRYSGSRIPLIDKEWLEELVMEASSTRGLVLTDDPVPDQPVKSRDHSAKRRYAPAPRDERHQARGVSRGTRSRCCRADRPCAGARRSRALRRREAHPAARLSSRARV